MKVEHPSSSSSIRTKQKSMKTSTTFCLSIFALAFFLQQTNADQIVQEALAKIFKYAAPAKIKALTNQLNKQTTKPKAKALMNKWIPANWKAPNSKIIKTDPYSKLAYTKRKALTFIDQRYSLKKYINFLVNKAVKTKYMTKAEAKKVEAIFWAADTKTKNNYTLTCQAVAVKGPKAFPNKNPPTTTKITTLTAQFASINPIDYKNLHWTL